MTAPLKLGMAGQNFSRKVNTVCTSRMELMTYIFAKPTKICLVHLDPCVVQAAFCQVIVLVGKVAQ